LLNINSYIGVLKNYMDERPGERMEVWVKQQLNQEMGRRQVVKLIAEGVGGLGIGVGAAKGTINVGHELVTGVRERLALEACYLAMDANSQGVMSMKNTIEMCKNWREAQRVRNEAINQAGKDNLPMALSMLGGALLWLRTRNLETGRDERKREISGR
jgi:hypothetical protein